jgi:hypothetical protein
VRRVRDARAEGDTEFVDHEEHWFEENYDEYPDEGNAAHLSDFDDSDDDEEEVAGTAIDAAEMVSACMSLRDHAHVFVRSPPNWPMHRRLRTKQWEEQRQ